MLLQNSLFRGGFVAAGVSIALLVSSCNSVPTQSSTSPVSVSLSRVEFKDGWTMLPYLLGAFSPGTVYSIADGSDQSDVEAVLDLKGRDGEVEIEVPSVIFETKTSLSAVAQFFRGGVLAGADGSKSCEIEFALASTKKKFRAWAQMDGALKRANITFLPNRKYFIVTDSLLAGRINYKVTTDTEAKAALDLIAARLGGTRTDKYSMTLRKSFNPRMVIAIKARPLN